MKKLMGILAALFIQFMGILVALFILFLLGSIVYDFLTFVQVHPR